MNDGSSPRSARVLRALLLAVQVVLVSVGPLAHAIEHADAEHVGVHLHAPGSGEDCHSPTHTDDCRLCRSGATPFLRGPVGDAPATAQTRSAGAVDPLTVAPHRLVLAGSLGPRAPPTG